MKSIVYILMALVIIGTVSAATSNAVEVDCGTNSWWDWNANTCQDYELQDEFNQVTDQIAQNNKVDKKQSKQINKVENTISDNAAIWSKDRKGTTMNRVVAYLDETYFDFLDNLFARKTTVDELEERVAELELYVEALNDGYTGIYKQGGLMYFGYDKEGSLSRVG